MARQLTPADLQRILNKVPDLVRDEVLKAMEQSVLLVEGQAKFNCGYIVGQDGPAPASLPGTAYQDCPYPKPPHVTGTLSRGNHGWVDDSQGDQIYGSVGNSVNEYNVRIHEGTSTRPARPFLYDAVRMQQDNVLKLNSAGIKKALEAAGRIP